MQPLLSISLRMLRVRDCLDVESDSHRKGIHEAISYVRLSVLEARFGFASFVRSDSAGGRIAPPLRAGRTVIGGDSIATLNRSAVVVKVGHLFAGIVSHNKPR